MRQNGIGVFISLRLIPGINILLSLFLGCWLLNAFKMVFGAASPRRAEKGRRELELLDVSGEGGGSGLGERLIRLGWGKIVYGLWRRLGEGVLGGSSLVWTTGLETLGRVAYLLSSHSLIWSRSWRLRFSLRFISPILITASSVSSSCMKVLPTGPLSTSHFSCGWLLQLWDILRVAESIHVRVWRGRGRFVVGWIVFSCLA